MSQNYQTASPELLWRIWWLLLNNLLDYLKITPPEKIRVNRLEVIRQFLKDNKIQVDAAHQADLMKSLESLKGMGLPFDVKGVDDQHE